MLPPPGSTLFPYTTLFRSGGADAILVGGGSNIVLGGAAGDTVTAGDGTNVVFGDSGEIDWSSDGTYIRKAFSLATGTGDVATLKVGDGPNLVIGGAARARIIAG